MDIKIYWCKKCNIPVIIQGDTKNNCTECGGSLNYISKDIRPVFSEERLLLEILKAEPGAFSKSSVWANRNAYIIDGKKIVLNNQYMLNADTVKVQSALIKYRSIEDKLEYYQRRFVNVNRKHLSLITQEARNYIANQASRLKRYVVSFSGGKDSTVISHLVMSVLGLKSKHIIIDTTIELDQTYEYIKEYKALYKDTPFLIGKNDEQNFYSVAEDIGPPAMRIRWCCYMFKTGIANRLCKNEFGNEKILTFYGIRKCESSSRSKYRRTEDRDEAIKIAGHRVAAPIFEWSDCDVWLYILGNNVLFNKAYRQGYARVGCYLCPNSNVRSDFLTKIYMPKKSAKWRELLISFAEKTNKDDAEKYADKGFWRFRMGGNGIKASEDVKIKHMSCTNEENAKIYELNRTLDESLYNLFIPFGIISKSLGRKLIGEVLVLDPTTRMPILSIQPFKSNYEQAVKVVFLQKSKVLERKVGYQIKKFNACRRCLKCESVCKYGAIEISKDSYEIHSDKCRRCQMCVTAKYLRGGCLMTDYLRTKEAV